MGGTALRTAGITALLAACWGVGIERAVAQTTGFSYPGSNLGNPGPPATQPDIQHQIAGGPTEGPSGPPEPGWTILPRVDVSEAFNDNIFQTQSDRQSDFTTYITPSVTVLGDEPRVRTRLFYAPTGIVYADHGSQDMVAQNLNATASITVIPEAFFVDLRGFAAVQPTFGGLPGVGGTGFTLQPGYGLNQANGFLTKSNATQSYNFGISPYVVHRFGTTGTVKAGYSYSYSGSNPISESFTVPGFGSTTGTSGTLNTHNEVVQFTSGEDFGRFRYLALANGTQYQGSGLADGAYQYSFTNQLGYAITDGVILFGEIGAEDIRYNGTPETKITDAVWSVGAQWTPNPDSSVMLGYGHKYGFDSFLLNASYAVTARTRLYAQYQTGLGTDLTQLQAFALASDVDTFGNSVDPTTGAPLFLTNNALGVTGNNVLYRSKTFSASAVTQLDRDQLSLQLLYQDRNTQAATTTFTPSSSSSFSATAGWQHQVNDDTSTSVYFSYGRQDGLQFVTVSGGETEDTYSAQAALRYNFTTTLSGVAQYTFVDRISNIGGRSFTQNVFLIGLSKQF
jgi:uncharacterized protein (PEP-CTERM system associated)